MQVKCASIHGNPESGNHPNPLPNKVLGRAEGPRTGWTWHLRHPKRRLTTFPSPSQSYYTVNAFRVQVENDLEDVFFLHFSLVSIKFDIS